MHINWRLLPINLPAESCYRSLFTHRLLGISRGRFNPVRNDR